MLKYGTQLPVPSSSVVRSEEPAVYGSTPPRLAQPIPRADMRVSVVDFDLPFVSILKLVFKWMAAGLLVSFCFIPVIIFVIFIAMAIFGTLLGHLFSGLPRP